jgi:hypothetical protein
MTACPDSPRTLIFFSRIRAIVVDLLSAPKASVVRVLDMMRDHGMCRGTSGWALEGFVDS